MPLVPAVPPAPPKPKAYQPGERIDIELVKGGAKMTFAYIPPGKFLMGSPESEKDRDSDETQHSVTLTRGFYMGVHPVTQAQYEAVTGTNPSQFKGDTLPVESVSWEDAVKFCNALSKKEGKTPCYMEGTWTTVPGADGYRLSTEADWEYASRGMTTEEYLKLESEGKPTPPFYWGGELNGTQANCNGSNPYGTAATDPPRYLGKTSPVGNYADKAPKKHPWGLCDVHGNVWEWCADWYDAAYYASSPKDDPTGAEDGSLRVGRGGCWDNGAWYCRSAYRGRGTPDVRYSYFGFRLAVVPSGQ